MIDKGAFVRTLGFEDIQHIFPEPRPWDGSSLGADMFICALGFEDRASFIPQELAKTLNSGAVRLSLLARYEINIEENESGGAKARDALENFSYRVKTFCADDPQETKRSINEAILDLQKMKGGRITVAFDISGASATLLLSVLGALFPYANIISLQIFYAEAQEYFPSRHEYDTALDILIHQGLSDGDDTSFSEQGVSDVDTNELYPGHNVENRPDHIIAVPSLRTSRLVGCLARIGDQPMASPGESLFWILSEPPGQLGWRLDLQRRIVNRQLATMSGRDPSAPETPTLGQSNSRVCSTHDYRQILVALIEQIDAAGGMNVSLVHMGSQLQSVGVALALYVRDEVTLLRSRPKQFNVHKYSRGIGPMWMIDFDSLPQVLHALRQIGKLQLQTKFEDARESRPIF